MPRKVVSRVCWQQCMRTCQKLGSRRLAALATMTGHDDCNVMYTKVMLIDVIIPVLAAMTAHMGQVSVQKLGLKVLGNVANVDTKTAIASARGIPVMLTAMTAHIGHAEVQLQGYGVLKRLACNHNNQIAITSVGGIAVVLAAMIAHTGHADVKLQGCGVLTSLTCNADNQTAIAAARGISVVLAVMKWHMRITDVQEQDCGALGNIGWSDTTLQKRIKDKGGVVVVQAAVAASGATAQCREHGQKLLGKLT